MPFPENEGFICKGKKLLALLFLTMRIPTEVQNLSLLRFRRINITYLDKNQVINARWDWLYHSTMPNCPKSRSTCLPPSSMDW